MSIAAQVRSVVKQATPYIPGKPIETLKRELGISRAYKMASNENALGPSPMAVAAMRRMLRQVHRYPDGAAFFLTQALAGKYGLVPEQVVVGNGSDELIVLVLRALINPGDEVIIADPTFLVYKIAANLCEATVRFVPQRNFQYDLPAMARQITERTRVIFIANPDNPTGRYVSREAVEQFLEQVPGHTLVFFDEAYYEFVQKPDYPQTLRYLERGNVAVSRSFSKIYGLGGLRVGWMASSPEFAGYLNRLREPFNVNLLAQEAARAALADTEHVQRTLAMVQQGREYLEQSLSALSVRFIPSVTNFILFELGSRAQEVYQRLLSRGIIVREMRAWSLPGYIRVTIGTERENKLFVRELKNALKTAARVRNGA